MPQEDSKGIEFVLPGLAIFAAHRKPLPAQQAEFSKKITLSIRYAKKEVGNAPRVEIIEKNANFSRKMARAGKHIAPAPQTALPALCYQWVTSVGL